MRFEEIWIKYGASNKIRFIAEQKLSVVLGEMKYKSIIKGHALSGCDVTSKVGTNEVELKNLRESFLKELLEKMTVKFKFHIKKQKNILLK